MARRWASGLGVTLVEVVGAERDGLFADGGIQQALRDGVDRGLVGGPPALPERATAYALREGRRTTGPADGLLAIARECPQAGVAALLAVVVTPAARGRALGTRALLLAERRLSEEGALRVLVRVPRTNGRGLYFVLRCGYTPVTGADAPREAGDATWFARRDGTTG